MSFRSEKHKKRLALVLGLILAGLLVLPVYASTLSGEENLDAPPASVSSEEETKKTEEDSSGPSLGSKGIQPLSNGFLTDNLHLSKSAAYNAATGKVDIQLEAFATGVILPSDDYPFDIVLVVDHSQSMNSTRLAYLKTALTAFIDKVEYNAAVTGLNHRISLVRYCGTYNNLLRDLTSNYSQIKNDVAAMTLPGNTANNGTRIDLGLSEAYSRINTTAKSPADHNRAVILFAAGHPEPAIGSGFNMTMANDALGHANNIKGLSKTSLYSVGVFDHVNQSVMHGDAVNHAGLYDVYSTGAVNSSWAKEVATLFSTNSVVERPMTNRLMNLISSNYTGVLSGSDKIGLSRATNNWPPYYDRVTITKAYNLDQSGYFLAAGKNDGAAYLSIYGTLADQILPPLGLSPTTSLLDYLTSHFQIKSTSPAPTVQVADATGYNTSTGQYIFAPAVGAPASITASYNLSDQALGVTGFDFRDYLVTKQPKPGTTGDYGKKLIVSFSADVDPAFFGGNGLLTNQPASGVYLNDGTPVKFFDIPRVSIPLKYETMDDVQETIALGQSIDLASLIEFVTQNGVNYTPNGQNNDHVKITYSLYHENDQVNPLATYVLLPGQTKNSLSWTGAWVTPDFAHADYVLKVVVEPSQTGTYPAITRSANISFDFVTGSITIVKEAEAGTTINPKETFFVLVSDAFGKIWKLAVKTGSPVSLKGLPVGTYTVSEDKSWSWRYQATIVYPDGGSNLTLQPGTAMNQTVVIVNEKINSQWLTDEDSVPNLFEGK